MKSTNENGSTTLRIQENNTLVKRDYSFGSIKETSERNGRNEKISENYKTDMKTANFKNKLSVTAEKVSGKTTKVRKNLISEKLKPLTKDLKTFNGSKVKIKKKGKTNSVSRKLKPISKDNEKIQTAQKLVTGKENLIGEEPIKDNKKDSSLELIEKKDAFLKNNTQNDKSDGKLEEKVNVEEDLREQLRKLKEDDEGSNKNIIDQINQEGEEELNEDSRQEEDEVLISHEDEVLNLFDKLLTENVDLVKKRNKKGTKSKYPNFDDNFRTESKEITSEGQIQEEFQDFDSLKSEEKSAFTGKFGSNQSKLVSQLKSMLLKEIGNSDNQQFTDEEIRFLIKQRADKEHLTSLVY